MTVKQVVLAHEPDAAWIIALWKAIHGGDPAPEMIAASVVTAMAPYLHGVDKAFTTHNLEAGFEKLGVKVTPPQAETDAESAVSVPRQYCFKFHNITICITLPTLKPPPIQ